jgi:flap endonuclease-1
MDRLSRRSVKVTKQHNEECRRLLKLMGIPFVTVRTCAGAYCPT